MPGTQLIRRTHYQCGFTVSTDYWNVSRNHFPQADLSVQTGAGERIGDLPLVAKVARESTAKINCPTSRWRIENRFQTQSAFLRPLMPAPQPWRIALHAQFAVRTFIVRLMSQGSEIRNREIHT